MRRKVDPPGAAAGAAAAAPAPDARGDASGAAAVRVGRLTPGSRPGALIVDFEGSAGGPRAARSIVVLDDQAVQQAVAVRQPVVLLFENGDPALPIVVGLVPAAPGAELLGSLLAPPAAAPAPALPAPATTAPVSAPAPPERIETLVDGKRVVLQGHDEVVLKCGEASITLKRDGKVILRGAYVETHAKGVNRIKGGSVKIN